MPPKAKDPKKGNLYKAGTPIKDVLPQAIKQPAREGRPARIPEFTPHHTVINPYQSQPDFEEWPGDEAALGFDFGLESQPGNYFVDPVKFSVPPSFRSNENHMIFWRRPKELIKSETNEEKLNSSTLVASETHLQRKKTIDLVELEEGRGASIYLPEDSGTSPFDKEDLEINLFSVIERQETAEEAEARVKEMTEKQQQQKKKPAKKEEPIDPNPQRVKDIKLSNVSMKEEIPAYAKWIASQLQLIKDKNLRDVHTKKPIWTKVYPQKDGAPVINPHGRYWVKLYHMGKEKKIEIDDKVPVIYGKSLFPRSVNNNEIWPFILSKALIKLNAPRWSEGVSSKEVEVGDGSIIYALTGYVPETINLSVNFQEKWKTVAEFLNDKKYNAGEQHVSCYCLPNYKPVAASGRGRGGKDISMDRNSNPATKNSGKRDSPRSQSESKNNVSLTKVSDGGDSKSPKNAPVKRREQSSMTTIKGNKPEPIITKPYDLSRDKGTNVIPGFAYSVVDLFENENFNMVYVLKRTENDLKLRQDYLNLQKVNLNKMTKEEKLEHRKIKKELKEKIFEEDNKRFELIKRPAIHYKLLKIRSSVGKAANLNFSCPFDQDDISLAKKCILNRLSKPPNYDMYDLKMDDKSVSSAQVVLETHTKVLPLDDFSRFENAKEPLKRGPGGAWVTNKDFESCFQYIQIFHDPTKYKYKESHSILARPEEELINYDDKEVLVIEGESEEEEKDNQGPLVPSLLYSYACTSAVNAAVEPRPSLVLQRYDFKNFEVASTYKTLNQAHDSDYLPLQNKNQVFRLQIISPLSSYIWLSSNLHFKLMSFADFLCMYEGYQLKNQQIEYPIVEKNRYHLFYKGVINPLNQRETVVCRLRNNQDLVMLKYIRIKLIELTDKNYKSDEEFKSGVVTFPLEKTYYVTKSVPIELEADKRYLLVIEGRVSETINEGTLEFDLLYRNTEFTLDTVDQVEPLEYMDKYVPTKYGILFRERLFLNNELQASFFVRICDVLGAASQQATQKLKKGEAPPVEEKDLTERRTIKLELFREDELVAYAFGQNKVILTNVGLHSTNNKDEPRNYYLQASFDLREWPEGKEENEHTANLHWILKVCSSDTIVIFRDTQKEDNIKAIKKSWEDKEPGRLDKAKVARKKFIIIEKQKRGEPLDQEELQILNEPRQRRNKEEEVKKDAKGKPQPKAKPPAGKAPGKKDEAPVEEKKEERVLPKSENHVMDEICKFLTHMEQPRLLQDGDFDDEEGVVRTEEEKNELREKILLGKEEAYGMSERNKRAKDKIKEIIYENKERVVKDLQVMREQMKEKFTELIKQREEFRKKDKEIKDKERALIALCKQEKPNYEEITKFLADNAEAQIDPELIKILEKVKKNAYITDKIEKLNNALTLFDLPVVISTLEEIRKEEIECDPELLEKADELVDMAEKNPTFIADKQKEAQKAMKGKKK